MSLADKLKPTRAEVRGDKVLAVLEGLEDIDRVALSEAINAPDYYSNADISRALQSEGYDIDSRQVQNLRRKIRDGKVVLGHESE